MPIKSIFLEAQLSPDVTEAMGEALELACRSLPNTAQSDLIKEIIAKRIVASAEGGLRAPQELCRDALASLGIESADDDA
jgi:hypothetical protein